MTRALVLRPEPGNARTCAALAAAGMAPVALPLFTAVPLAWSPPDPNDYDALLLTSAQAVRLAGDGLAPLSRLPVVAVGEATAAAARAAGLHVAIVGNGDAAAAVARASAYPRLLHLAGREHVAQPGVVALPVYASKAVAVAPGALAAALDAVVLLHSARAAQRFAALAGSARRRIRLAALSPAVAAAAGTGWARVAVADRPDDTALIQAALAARD